MGITTQLAVFARAPDLGQIIAEASRLSGLELTCRELEPGDLFRFHADVAFACYPREHVVLTTRGWLSEEGTLHDVLSMTLESLGGKLHFPLSPTRRARCAGPLTPAMIRARHGENWRAWMLALLNLPVQLLAAAWSRMWRRNRRKLSAVARYRSLTLGRDAAVDGVVHDVQTRNDQVGQ
jgi:hypothetical protein